MTTQPQTFSDQLDFVQRAQVGDMWDNSGERSMTRATVVEVDEHGPRGRRLTVSELFTRYTGRPYYVYQTTRHTKFYSSDDPRWVTVDLNIGLAVDRVATSAQSKRFNRSTLIREHNQHL